MNIFKQLLGATLLSMGAFGLFIACGGETACDTDADCASGETCIDSVCDDGSNNGAANNGVDNNGVDNNGATNNGATNNGVSTTYLFVEIEDTTTEGCDVNDPGSDIMWSYIADSSGTPLAFGSIVDEAIVVEGNNFTSGADSLTGDAPSAGIDTCPDFSEDSITALGCTGSVYINFLDAVDTPTPIDPDVHDVIVAEYSTQCGGSADDTFNINVCTDSVAAGSADWTSCTLNIGSGSGEVTGSF